MPPHRVTRLRDLLDAAGQPAPNAQKLVSWLGRIVESATHNGPQDQWTLLPVACAECEAEALRPIAARIVGPGIEWLCTHCHSSGTITGWTGSSFDLSGRASESGDAATMLLFTRLDELEAARGMARASDLRQLLASASAQPDHVLLLATADELTRLLSWLREQASTLTGAPRYALERLAGRCDAALLLLEQQNAEPPPTLH